MNKWRAPWASLRKRSSRANINVGLIFGLLQFVSTFAIAFAGVVVFDDSVEAPEGRYQAADFRARIELQQHTLYPDGKTEEQSTQENAEEFSQSQESAKVAALEERAETMRQEALARRRKALGQPRDDRFDDGDVIDDLAIDHDIRKSAQ